MRRRPAAQDAPLGAQHCTGRRCESEALGAGAARGRRRRGVGELDVDDVASVERVWTTQVSPSCHMS